MNQENRARTIMHRAAGLIAAGALSFSLTPSIALAESDKDVTQQLVAEQQPDSPATSEDAAAEANSSTNAANEASNEANPGASSEAVAAAETATAQTANASTPLAMPVAQIGDTAYATLDEAVAAAGDSDVVELLANGELTVGSISKPVTINGNGFTVAVPKKINENSALSLHSSLTLNNTIVNFTAPAEWNLVVYGDGTLSLNKGSKCNFSVSGIYASPNATINANASSFNFSNTNYTAMMAEKYGNLNLDNGASLSIKHANRGDGTANGITSFKINANNSTLDVSENENQGLVRCWLTLSGSTATVSGNVTGMTCYTNTNALTMENGSKLTMENNKNAGIFMWGGKVDVQDGNTLTITGTGNGSPASDYSPYCGAVASYYYYNTYSGSVTFADGASVSIANNPFGGLRNYATTYLGAGTTIENNGYNGDEIETPYGGGIWNCGSLQLSPSAKVFNNHAQYAGDDIYNTTGSTADGIAEKYTGTYTGSISFGDTGTGWVLDDCNEAIDGWYNDLENNRWNAHPSEDNAALVSLGKSGTFESTLALKAAHGLTVTYEYVGEFPEQADKPKPETKLQTLPYFAATQGSVTGWTFDGWYADEACTTKWVDYTPLEGNMTLYGKWTKEPESEPGTPSDPSQPGNQANSNANIEQQASSTEHLAQTGDAALPFGIAIAGIALIAGSAALISRKLLKH